jgi:hypothetical protein
MRKSGDLRCRYRPGQKVAILRDIESDGSYRTITAGALLAGEGERGEILGVGYQEEKRVVYFVLLGPENRVIGCFEEDLFPDKKAVRLSAIRSGGRPGRKKSVGGVRHGRDL